MLLSSHVDKYPSYYRRRCRHHHQTISPIFFFSADPNIKLFRNARFVAVQVVLMLIQVSRVMAVRGLVGSYRHFVGG